MHGIQLTKHVIRNGWMEYQLTTEREKLRAAVLDLYAKDKDSAVALKWFSYYGRKLQQLGRIQAKLATKCTNPILRDQHE